MSIGILRIPTVDVHTSLIEITNVDQLASRGEAFPLRFSIRGKNNA